MGLAALLLTILTSLPLTPEPYGGCDEAHLYPGTAGAQWCATWQPDQLP